MQKQPNDDARKVVPRWRELLRTPSAELKSVLVARKPFEFSSRLEWGEAVLDERRRASIYAQEQLVSLSLLGASHPEVSDVVAALAHNQDARPLLRKLATRLNLRRDIEHVDASEIEEAHRRQKIAELKRLVREHPRNAIAFVELARLYSIGAQNIEAKENLSRALLIAPFNRYVVRSASRFFVHSRNPDLALHILKRAAATDDPWIMAAVVATADLADKTREIPIKHARGLLARGLPAIQTSELNASMATLELQGGSTKKAKRLFRDSAMDPTDNAAAQITWASEKHKLHIDVDLSEVQLSFEAGARKSLQSKDWDNYVVHAEKWLIDEAFSSRPAIEGSYVAAEFMGDYERSLRFSLAGLKSNPNDAYLLNNAAYAHSELGQIADAKEKLEKAKWIGRGDDVSVALLATEGHILYGLGDQISAEKKYLEALEKSLAEKDKRTAEAVIIHWLREAMKSQVSIGDMAAIVEYFSEKGSATREGKEIFSALIDVGREAPDQAQVVDLPFGRVLALEDNSDFDD